MQQGHGIYEVLLGLSLIEHSNCDHDTIAVRYFIKCRYFSNKIKINKMKLEKAFTMLN